MSHLTETETSLVMAEYCQNSCSKCPRFARTRPRHSSIALSMVVWSLPCERAANAATVHNTSLHTIVCYLQKIFNRNLKVKQQVNKLNAVKSCVFKNRVTFWFAFFNRFAKIRTSNFRNILNVWWEVLQGFCWKFSSLSSGERILKLC